MIDLLIRPNNTWAPKELNADITVACLKEAGNTMNGHLAIFQIEPYIDSLFVKYHHEDDDMPKIIKRFTFHDGFIWRNEDEKFFTQNCIFNPKMTYTYEAIDSIFKYYSENYPEWHLKRYYTKNLRLLDHIYHCMREGTAKEMLYKAGLDELAVNIDDVDEYNLLSSKPSEIYDGISMRVLRALNCKCGSLLLSTGDNRKFLKALQLKFPDMFKELMNDAQCRYLNRLMDNNLTVGEVGRLYKSRHRSLASIWVSTQYDSFLMREKQIEENAKSAEEMGQIDPIYKEFIINKKIEQTEINSLRYYLLQSREDFDKQIRRANRRREYGWQERDKGYSVKCKGKE